jgi:hypothetical protein
MQTALGQAFGLLDGIGTLMSGENVSVRISLTIDGQFEKSLSFLLNYLFEANRR